MAGQCEMTRKARRPAGTKVGLVINLKTTKALGLKLSLPGRVDEVIE